MLRVALRVLRGRSASAALLAAVLVAGGGGGPASRSYPRLAAHLPASYGPSSSGVVATRSALARKALVESNGRRLDGAGVSIAVVDTGIDATHPSFGLRGSSKIVRSLTAVGCATGGGSVGDYTPPVFFGLDPEDPSCVVDVPKDGNSDALHGGHGTFVAGVAVGNEFTLPDGTSVSGHAPGARIVMLSTTTTLVGATNAFAWILENHAAPCGRGVPPSVCPPIKVVSASWVAIDPWLPKIERKLAKAGVVTVWANGNGGGDGSTNQSNDVPAADPTPGVLTVASYDDLGSGSRKGNVADTSSRGDASRPGTWPDISAPGVNVVSSCRAYQAICVAVGAQPRDGPGDQDIATYFTGSGTSWAAPAVAGIVAMLFQAKPTATPAEIDDALKRTTHKYKDGAPYRNVGRYSSSFDKGSGLIDAYAAALEVGARRRTPSSR